MPLTSKGKKTVFFFLSTLKLSDHEYYKQILKNISLVQQAQSGDLVSH